MIVVEGPDGSGKTTLVRQLFNHFPNALSLPPHSGTPRGELPNQGVKERPYNSLSWAVRGGPIYVHDRLFFSELVYGPILRGKNLFSEYEQRFVMQILQVLNCPVIFCLPPTSVMKQNLEDSDQLEGVEANFDYICEGYVEQMMLARDFNLNTTLYDYTGSEELEAVERRVMFYIEERGQRGY